MYSDEVPMQFEDEVWSGHAKAQCCLGTAYWSGRWGVPAKDEEEAVKWWRKAAAQGHARRAALGAVERERERRDVHKLARHRAPAQPAYPCPSRRRSHRLHPWSST